MADPKSTPLEGEEDLALEYLQQAISFEEPAREWARDDIAWRDQHNNPRFQALIYQERTIWL
jgi:hypothetical protein